MCATEFIVGFCYRRNPNRRGRNQTGQTPNYRRRFRQDRFRQAQSGPQPPRVLRIARGCGNRDCADHDCAPLDWPYDGWGTRCCFWTTTSMTAITARPWSTAPPMKSRPFRATEPRTPRHPRHPRRPICRFANAATYESRAEEHKTVKRNKARPSDANKQRCANDRATHQISLARWRPRPMRTAESTLADAADIFESCLSWRYL